jgi:hypothetical protein
MGFFRGFGLHPFRERVSSLQPPVTRAVRRFLRSVFCFAEPDIFEDRFAFLWFENEKEIDIRFIKKLFSTEEPFVLTPSQSIPGLDPMVVQA